MGTSISKVKSLQLDDWSREQVEMMRLGNVARNAQYNPSGESLNSKGQEMEAWNLERFMRRKYETRELSKKLPPVVAVAPTLPFRPPSQAQIDTSTVERPSLAVRAQSVPALPTDRTPARFQSVASLPSPAWSAAPDPASATATQSQYIPQRQYTAPLQYSSGALVATQPQPPSNPFQTRGFMSNSTFSDMQSIQSNLPHINSAPITPNASYQVQVPVQPAFAPQIVYTGQYVPQAPYQQPGQQLYYPAMPTYPATNPFYAQSYQQPY
jgi:stromal membrane-associated protein